MSNSWRRLARHVPSDVHLADAESRGFSLSKRFKLAGRSVVEFKVDAFNLLRTVNYSFGDQEINSANFGRLTGTNTSSARILQLSLKLDF